MSSIDYVLVVIVGVLAGNLTWKLARNKDIGPLNTTIAVILSITVIQIALMSVLGYWK